MLVATTKRLRINKRGVSNVIVMMLSLVLIVIIVSNVVLWSYQMNEADRQRIQERISLMNVERASNSSARFSFANEGPMVSRIVGIWITNSTLHRRYDTDFFIDSGANADYIAQGMDLPSGSFTVRAITDKGNIAVFNKG